MLKKIKKETQWHLVSVVGQLFDGHALELPEFRRADHKSTYIHIY